jgi:alpha,alpha-trehalase
MASAGSGGGAHISASAASADPCPRAAPLRPHASLFTAGPLLAAVQRARLFEDSKTFLDMPLRCAPDVALAAFHALPLADDEADTRSTPGSCAPTPRAPSRAALAAFVGAHFGAAGAELTPAAPAEWTAALPPWMHALPPDAAALARAVHARWALLGRTSAEDSADTRSDSDDDEAADGTAAADPLTAPTRLPTRRTMLRLPRPCVVPGDRFREVYYWDSYWVVRGLLASAMPRAAADAVRNLLSLASATRPSGHVPNGARTYYLGRSQPPLLARTLAAVHAATGDDALVRDALPVLRAEWRYYTSGRHAVRIAAGDGRVYALSRYWADTEAPRPESWREDVAAAEGLRSGDDASAAALWRNIAAAAESGWDFSTRWMEEEDAGAADAPPAAEAPPPADAAAALRTLRTVRVVPADLNALLVDMARTAARLAAAVGGCEADAAFFSAAADERAEAVEALLWDDAGAQWRDLILDPSPAEDEASGAEDGSVTVHVPRRGRPSRRPFASNWVPLWCDCAVASASASAAERAERAAASLAASGLVLPGGVAASATHSGQQWDFPNAWPPLQHMLVEGLNRSGGGATSAALAERIAGAYLRAAAAGLAGAGGAMHEKYDARADAADGGAGRAGGGGEYAPQVGFGWSNGVALALLQRYRHIPPA